MTVTVFELAKELGKTSKELIALLKTKGITVENHMSLLNAEQVAAVKPAPAQSAAKAAAKKKSTGKTGTHAASAPAKPAVSKAGITKGAATKAGAAKSGSKSTVRAGSLSSRAAAPEPNEEPASPTRRTVLIKRKRTVEEAPVESSESVEAVMQPPAFIETPPLEPTPAVEPPVAPPLAAKGPSVQAPVEPSVPSAVTPAAASATTETKPTPPPAAKPEGGDQAAKPKRF
ncbi:MAG TPA: translation initiation factor IF-2 N-terminal domain-containing protein, partial [Nitrospiria bacterium]|nr:translation initiation factor IF-2 N-terminal domain-containing protein [Nitrospiria bacterium]